MPNPAYRIQTARLILRCWQPSDAPRLKAAVDESRAHLKPWMPWAEGDPEPEQNYIDRLRTFRGNFDLGTDFIYGIFNSDESLVLGGTGLHTRRGVHTREIGYWLHKDFVGQGYATELTRALTKVAFEIDHIHRVEIRCDPLNHKSAAVPKRLGFKHEATLREDTQLSDGTWRDTMIWALLESEYHASDLPQTQITAWDAAGKIIL